MAIGGGAANQAALFQLQAADMQFRAQYYQGILPGGCYRPQFPQWGNGPCQGPWRHHHHHHHHHGRPPWGHHHHHHGPPWGGGGGWGGCWGGGGAQADFFLNARF